MSSTPLLHTDEHKPTFGRAIRDEFLLEPGIAYLNHGERGGPPRQVLAAAEQWRRRIERQPVRFMRRELPGLVRAAAAELAAFVGAEPDDVVFVDNATTGTNVVLQSLRLDPGDEVLTTTHAYGAVCKTIEHVCHRTGARMVQAPIPLPVTDEAQIATAITTRFTSRTKLLVIDHVASPTALIFPVKTLTAFAHAHGVRVLVDGAHAPGMLDLDVPELGADFYVGNCHKWLCGARGAGFLWADKASQDLVHPIVISHGFGCGFFREFLEIGSRDPSPWLATTAALEFMHRLGPSAVRAHNDKLLLAATDMLCRAWGAPASGPPQILSAMATIRLPLTGCATPEHALLLHDWLWDRHGIEVRIVPFGDELWARISAQIYNEAEDFQRLAEVRFDEWCPD